MILPSCTFCILESRGAELLASVLFDSVQRMLGLIG